MFGGVQRKNGLTVFFVVVFGERRFVCCCSRLSEPLGMSSSEFKRLCSDVSPDHEMKNPDITFTAWKRAERRQLCVAWPRTAVYGFQCRQKPPHTTHLSKRTPTSKNYMKNISVRTGALFGGNVVFWFIYTHG